MLCEESIRYTSRDRFAKNDKWERERAEANNSIHAAINESLHGKSRVCAVVNNEEKAVGARNGEISSCEMERREENKTRNLSRV